MSIEFIILDLLLCFLFGIFCGRTMGVWGIIPAVIGGVFMPSFLRMLGLS